MSETKSEALEPTQEMEAAELSEVFRVRREKLAALQEAGKNPFEKTKYEVRRRSSPILWIKKRGMRPPVKWSAWLAA